MSWVLTMTSRGKTLYFREMVPLGPRTTADAAEAAKFATEGDAKAHPAYADHRCFFQAVELTTE